MVASGLLALALAGPAQAGSAQVASPGTEVWRAPLAGFEPPGSCEVCRGPRGFAVRDGVAWFALSDRLVSSSGARLSLPSPGVDVAAGPTGLWVLCREQLARLADGALVEQPRRWVGEPLEVSGDGAVLSVEGLDGQPLPEGRASPWGAGLALAEEGGHWIAAWPGRPALAVPGADIVDLRPVGMLADGAWVLALTDSRDGSAPDAVRFVATRPGSIEVIASGAPNGDLVVRPRRHYAIDPVTGQAYTLVVEDEALSLRRY